MGQVEAALVQERAILKEVVARAPAAIALLWGPEHRVRLFNAQWLECFPEARESLGRRVEDALPEPASVLMPLLQRVRETGEPFAGTNISFRSQGALALAGRRYFTFTASPVPVHADSDGVLVVGMETTEEVRRRRQLERELASERGIADVLQRSLLPGKLPDFPGIAFAARYVPGSTEVGVGGDWYDVIPLGGGCIGLAMGDVVGHGIDSVSTMGQLRHALRAYALEGHGPAGILERLDRLLEPQGQMATLLYAVFELSNRKLVFVSAGHPPALLVAADGSARYLSGRPYTPVGTGLTTRYQETVTTLDPNFTLVLYTDGLVEDRCAPIQEGLERLRRAAGTGAADVEDFCDSILNVLRPRGSDRDDVALLVLRDTPLPQDRLRLELPARAAALAGLRSTLGIWLRDAGASPDELYEIVTACNEACMNAIEHGYGLDAGPVEIEAECRQGEIAIGVRDRGRWRPHRGPHQGYGLAIMRALTDETCVHSSTEGTQLLMRRRLQKANR
jgi:anti-sigma regulatory factor (Ser/Thr protein kinase)